MTQKPWDESKVNRVRNQGVPTAKGRFDFKQLNEAEGGTNILGTPDVEPHDTRQGIMGPRAAEYARQGAVQGVAADMKREFDATRASMFTGPPHVVASGEPSVFEDSDARVSMPQRHELNRALDDSDGDEVSITVRYEPKDGPAEDRDIVVKRHGPDGFKLDVSLDEPIPEEDTEFLVAAAAAVGWSYPANQFKTERERRRWAYSRAMFMRTSVAVSNMGTRREAPVPSRSGPAAADSPSQRSAGQAGITPAARISRFVSRGLGKLKSP